VKLGMIDYCIIHGQRACEELLEWVMPPFAYSQGNEQCHSRLQVLVDGIPSRQASCESPMSSHHLVAVCGKTGRFAHQRKLLCPG